MINRRQTFRLLAMSFGALVLTLHPLRSQEAGGGFLKVKANPGRAGVFVDGKYLGPAASFRIAKKYSLPAGEHELVLRDPRYEEYKMTVKIEAGKTTTVKQALQPRTLASPPFGRLRLTGFEKFAAVFINEGYMGHADEFNAPEQGLLLNPGDYDLKVVSQSGSSLLEQKITIRQDEVLRLQPK